MTDILVPLGLVWEQSSGLALLDFIWQRFRSGQIRLWGRHGPDVGLEREAIKDPHYYDYALGRPRDETSGYYAEIRAERAVVLELVPPEDRADYLSDMFEDLAISAADWDRALSEFVPPATVPAAGEALAVPREVGLYLEPAMPMSDDDRYARHLMLEQRSGRFPEIPSPAIEDVSPAEPPANLRKAKDDQIRDTARDKVKGQIADVFPNGVPERFPVKEIMHAAGIKEVSVSTVRRALGRKK